MKTTLKIITLLLLLINGAGAIYGGYHLISHPDGSTLQMSTDLLQHSPFSNYLFPGIILLLANGVFSFFVMGTMIYRHRFYPWFILAQGVILTGWIVIQVIMIQVVAGLQLIFFSIGILLTLFGWKHLRK